MGKNIIFRDYFTINKPAEEDVVKWEESAKEFSDEEVKTKRGLRVTLEASHAGLINKNNRLYLPSRMDDGIPSWTVDRPKPAKILKHHDAEQDPVGIIRDASFIDTTPDSIKKDPDVAILFDKNAELEDQVDAVNRLVKSGKLSSKEWRGLGYTKLVAEIYDNDTIEKILDGRLDSVSTSFRPKKALCTVCKSDIMDSWCGHRPGKSYLPPSEEEEDARKNDKILCILIPDSHENRECSFVTFDADPLTAVEINEDAEVIESYKDVGGEEIGRDDSSQEFEMFFQDSEKVQGQKEKEDAKLVAKTRNALPASAFCGPNRSYPAHDRPHAINALARAKQYASTALYNKIKACVCRKFSGLPACSKDSELAQVDDKFTDKEMEELLTVKVRDPLTGEDVLLGDYIFEGSLAEDEHEDNCSIDQDNDDAYVLPSCSDLQLLEEDALLKFFDLLHAEIISRDLESKIADRTVSKECEECKDKLLKIGYLENKIEENEKNSIDKENTITALRNELRFYISDYQHQIDEYVKLGTEVASIKLEYLSTLGTLMGKYETRDAAVEDIKDSIEDKWTILINEFDLDKARDKLNDGMSREPKGMVENPAHVIDEDDGFDAKLTEVGKRAAKRLRGMIKDSKFNEAKSYSEKMKNLGVFPKNINFEDFLVTSMKVANDNN